MSLQLDERQRAMLKEMGITVWWPKPVVLAAEPAVAAPKAALPPVAKKSENDEFEENNIFKTSNFNIKNIANYTIITRTVAEKNSETIGKNSYSVITPQFDQLTWPLLAQAGAVCQACKLCEGRTKTVFGSVPNAGQGSLPTGQPEATPQADWLIVGDVPGDAEDQAGVPFAGDAGQLLGNMLKAMGLATAPAAGSRVYLTTVIKCRPPGNRNPLPEEVAQCAAYLHRQIELLQPKIILTLGKLAAQTLLRDTLPDVAKLPAGKLRAQVHAYQPQGRNIPLVATYPPAYLLRNPQEKARVWEDLVLAMETLKSSVR